MIFEWASARFYWRPDDSPGLNMEKKIFVDNLNPTTTNEDLAELFSCAGPVGLVTIAVRKAPGPGHAFVEMESDHGANQAVRLLNDRKWNGLRLIVTHAGLPRKTSLGFTGGPAPRRTSR